MRTSHSALSISGATVMTSGIFAASFVNASAFSAVGDEEVLIGMTPARGTGEVGAVEVRADDPRSAEDSPWSSPQSSRKRKY